MFAKTDLVHAQQEGFSLPAICDGLCHGLAVNIANTLFKHEQPRRPVIFCGGVARNRAVTEHISSMMGARPLVDEMAHLYGAFGAASRMLDRAGRSVQRTVKKQHILGGKDFRKQYGHPPLELVKSSYPEFDAHESYEFQSGSWGMTNKVEVDIYRALDPDREYPLYLGMDIGSTSTKAVWMTPEKEVLAGFYTRTAGRPVEAMCSLLEAMDDLAGRHRIGLEFLGAATTGSGRKFAGKLAGADQIMDEITAHARAAVQLHPHVDTIIEIGGQDSKFTTLKKGRVTFCIMNTVCAAGTGSFIEEQAEKLGVSLLEYADRARWIRSPIASDRCTVFMERDINYYLSRGYTVNEVLAAALHAISENYLNKVAVESSIGDIVCFQGATAKNRTLVAAFEQRLNRPIHVSSFCHLTGALGAALYLADKNVSKSTFRGLDLYRERIPIRSEVCQLCPNHCKITVADMQDGPVAYGFLCGRDYDTRHFVDNNKSGFDLVRSHGRIFLHKNRVQDENRPIVGIPSALYMHQDLSMWVDFFNRLGIRTVTGHEAGEDALEEGKELAGAEFCAPMTVMHGQVAWLARRADFIFLPYYLDERDKDGDARRQYCYYSQYIPSLVAGLDQDIAARLISPVMKYLYSNLHLRLEVCRAAGRIDHGLSYIEIIRAFEGAKANQQAACGNWRETYQTQLSRGKNLSVMLLGRPYTVLNPVMNKKIPQIFSTLGIKTFFQDMIDLENRDMSSIEPFLRELHWNYAADIIKACKVVSEAPGVYPVLMTSFNCSPDSFIRDVFQNLMEGADKPYLILEMDEHGSSVGYETRIEAAVRAFQNHAGEIIKQAPSSARINPVKASSMHGKTVLFPNWDPITCRFLVANLQREGIDARLMQEKQDVIKRSMRLNSGQCIPINAIAQEFVEHVRQNDIDPEKAVLWIANAEIACNIRLYPYRLKQMIASFGKGMEKAGVYTGSISFVDVSIRAAMNSYFAFMFGGMLRRMGCRIRPYEKHPGETDSVLESCVQIIEETFLGLRDRETTVDEAIQLFASIATCAGKRVQVAIFGDLYVRDNPEFNQDLIGFIEAHGGEAITTPYSDYVKMIAPAYFRKWFAEGKYLILLGNRTLLETMVHREKAYYRHFSRILNEPQPVYDVQPDTILSRFGLIPENSGESMDNILKIYYLKKYYPDLSLFVQTSPSFCCPSLVTEAMARSIEKHTGVPIVSITYDGTGGDKNRKIIPYLEFALEETARSGA